jgi:hypothetical protein
MQLPSDVRFIEVGLDEEEGQRQAQLERPLGNSQQEWRAQVRLPPSAFTVTIFILNYVSIHRMFFLFEHLDTILNLFTHHSSHQFNSTLLPPRYYKTPQDTNCQGSLNVHECLPPPNSQL